MSSYREYLGMSQEINSLMQEIRSEPTITADYGDLRAILDEAYAQSAHGKGRERHGNSLPWDKQPILQITRSVGVGFPAG